MTKDLNLRDLLEIDPSKGLISLWDYRMLMFSACAMGLLRKELIETLGPQRARGVMKRFGYAAGLADGHALSERFPVASKDDQMLLGNEMHALEGLTQVQRIESETQVDLANGLFHVEAYWLNSWEADQHLTLYGKSKEPVCWNLAGYATGHSSAAAGRATLVIERECRAMGHDQCRFVADWDEEFPAFLDNEREDYNTLRLPEVLDELQQTIRLQKAQLEARERTIIDLNSKLSQNHQFGGLLGSSNALQRSMEMARRVAPVDATVLIEGESGTGKELIARGIHDHSLRSEKGFLAINCGALPDSMQEAELFGYARGAFTGAVQAQAGIFESASGGTLFLDEIGELSLQAQTKMLRAIQEGEVKRLGETQVRQVDVRIIAATHRDLRDMVSAKTFREDLYYRLEVVTIKLPPLRERENDALLLADYFVDEYAKKFNKEVNCLSAESKRLIARYTWPGNVRELRHAIERAVILADGTIIEAVDLPEKLCSPQIQEIQQTNQPQADRWTGQQLMQYRRELAGIDDPDEQVKKALRLASGHREKAAVLLNMGRTTLWRRMKQLNLL